MLNDYTCLCPPGFTDENCSVNIDECLPNPCQNGGTCTDQVNAYSCQCASGYTADNRSIEINECMRI